MSKNNLPIFVRRERSLCNYKIGIDTRHGSSIPGKKEKNFLPYPNKPYYIFIITSRLSDCPDNRINEAIVRLGYVALFSLAFTILI